MTANWTLITQGDKAAFINLYESEYQSLFIYGFTLSADKEITKDCIQEVFLEIWKNHDSLNKEVTNVRSYLFTWLRRKINQEYARLDKKLPEYLSSDRSISEESYEELLIAFQVSEEKKASLKIALNKLTKKQLEIIRLKFFENLSYEQISEKTALTHRTVYNLIYEALKNLKHIMHFFIF